MKAVVKYPGSKWSLTDWIISLFPDHHSYLEPFFGSGAVLFNKPRSDIETVNDLDGNVINLFEWIKRAGKGEGIRIPKLGTSAGQDITGS